MQNTIVRYMICMRISDRYCQDMNQRSEKLENLYKLSQGKVWLSIAYRTKGAAEVIRPGGQNISLSRRAGTGVWQVKFVECIRVRYTGWQETPVDVLMTDR